MSRTVARSPEAERARYQWVTTGTAAKLIGGDERPVSTSHVLRLIEAKELRARNVAMPGSKRKDWRVDPKSVEEFLDRRTVEVEPRVSKRRSLDRSAQELRSAAETGEDTQDGGKR